MQMSTCVLKHIVTQCMNSEMPTPMYIHAKVYQNNCARNTYTCTCILMFNYDASKHDPSAWPSKVTIQGQEYKAKNFMQMSLL